MASLTEGNVITAQTRKIEKATATVVRKVRKRFRPKLRRIKVQVLIGACQRRDQRRLMFLTVEYYDFPTRMLIPGMLRLEAKESWSSLTARKILCLHGVCPECVEGLRLRMTSPLFAVVISAPACTSYTRALPRMSTLRA